MSAALAEARSATDETSAAAGRALRATAVGAGAALPAIYVVLILTPLGQDVDDDAYLGRVIEARQPDQSWWLNYGTLAVAALAVLAALLVALRRRRLIAAIGLVVAYAVAVLAAQILKAVLPRPDLSPLDEYVNPANTFPSGHTTIAMGAALTLLVVCPPRAREWIAVPSTVFAAGVATAVVASGWHRPSDALGGLCLATAFVAGWWSVRAPAVCRFAASVSRRVLLLTVAVGTGLVAALLLYGVRAPEAAVEEGVSAWGFLTACLVIASLAGVLVFSVAACVRSVALSPLDTGALRQRP